MTVFNNKNHLVESTDSGTAPTDLLAKLGLLSHADIVAAGAEENVRWTVEGLMWQGTFAMLSGESKSGKTAIATNLAYCVATGRPFLGMAVEQGPVLWLAYEESRDERAYLCRGYGEAPVYTVERPAPIDTSEGLDDLRRCIRLVEEIEGRKVGLVVVDPLAGAVATDSLSELMKARRALQGLNDLRREMGVSVLILHHKRKGAGGRGDQSSIADSHQLQAAVSQWWVMAVRKGETRSIQLYGGGRGRHAQKVWHLESSDEWTYERVEGEPMKAGTLEKADEQFLNVLRTASKPMTAAQVAKEAGLKRTYAKNLATELKDAKRIRVAGKVSNSFLYALAE